MRNKIDECMAWAALSGTTGLFIYADVLGCGRAYGYTFGSVVEFIFGTLFVIASALLFYLAGLYRDRLFRAKTERRRRAREERQRARETYHVSPDGNRFLS